MERTIHIAPDTIAEPAALSDRQRMLLGLAELTTKPIEQMTEADLRTYHSYLQPRIGDTRAILADMQALARKITEQGNGDSERRYHRKYESFRTPADQIGIRDGDRARFCALMKITQQAPASFDSLADVRICCANANSRIMDIFEERSKSKEAGRSCPALGLAFELAWRFVGETQARAIERSMNAK